MRVFLLLGFVALAASAKLPLSTQSSGYNYQSPSGGGGFSDGQLGGAPAGPFGGQVGRPTASPGLTGNQLGGSSAFFGGSPSATNIPSRPGVAPQGPSEGYNYERPASGGSFSSIQAAGSHSGGVGVPSGSSGRPSQGAAPSQFSQFDEPSTGFGGVASASNIPNGLGATSQGLNNFGVVPSAGQHSGSAGGFGSSGSFGSSPTTTFVQQGRPSVQGGSSSGFGAAGSPSSATGGPGSSPFSGAAVSGGRPGGLPSTFSGPGGSSSGQADFGAASSAAFSTLGGNEEFVDDFRPAATPEEQLANLENALPGGGVPGEDFPILSEVPNTGFMCEDQAVSGYYADTAEEAGCQVFHICQIRESGLIQKDSFLCPNGTIFNQEHLVCDWWNNFDCSTAESWYSVNEQIGQISSTGTGVEGSASGFPGTFGSVSDEGQLGGAGANQLDVFAGPDGFPNGQFQASAGGSTQFVGVPSGFGGQSSQFGGQSSQQVNQQSQFGGQPIQFGGQTTQFGDQPSQFAGQAAQSGGRPGQQTSGQGQQQTSGISLQPSSSRPTLPGTPFGGVSQPGSQTGQFGGQLGAGSSSSFAGVPSSGSPTGQSVGGSQFGFSEQGQFPNQVPSSQYLTPSVTSGTSSTRPGSGRPGAGSASAGGSATGSAGAGRPGVGSSSAGRPGNGSAGAGRPGSGSSGTGRPGTAISGAGRPGTGSSGAGRPGTGSFGAGRPAAGSSGAGRPDAGRPSIGGTGIGSSGAGRPGSAGRPSADEPSNGRPSSGSQGAGRPAPSALYGAPSS